ncbi:MAG TPA: DUF4339 domain-containing protein [Verrucomicrobiae bacterium]
MNYFMIGGDKQEYGPVNAELIKQWIREGRANGDTLLRAESETEWKPLRTFADFQSQIPPGPPPLPTLPKFIAPQPTIGIPEPNDVPVSVGHAFARAWHLVAEHFGVVAAGSFIVWLILNLMASIPHTGGLVAMIFYGPLFGGLYMLFIKLIREGEASPGDVFTLVRDTAMPLMGTGVITLVLVQIAVLFCCLPSIYLHIAWLLSLPLVADRGMGFWDAMELSRRTTNRHWFKIFGLCILAFLPFVVFTIYSTTHQFVDIWPYFKKLWAAAIEMRNAGNPNQAEIMKIMNEAEAVQRSYGTSALIGQLLFLISLPFGIGSLAFVYEDLFGRKK